MPRVIHTLLIDLRSSLAFIWQSSWEHTRPKKMNYTDTQQKCTRKNRLHASFEPTQYNIIKKGGGGGWIIITWSRIDCWRSRTRPKHRSTNKPAFIIVYLPFWSPWKRGLPRKVVHVLCCHNFFFSVLLPPPPPPSWVTLGRLSLCSHFFHHKGQSRRHNETLILSRSLKSRHQHWGGGGGGSFRFTLKRFLLCLVSWSFVMVEWQYYDVAIAAITCYWPELIN